MMEKEKVVKGLQNLRDAIAFDYIRETDHAVETLDNAIAMLKEQQTKIERFEQTNAELENIIFESQ